MTILPFSLCKWTLVYADHLFILATCTSPKSKTVGKIEYIGVEKICKLLSALVSLYLSRDFFETSPHNLLLK